MLDILDLPERLARFRGSRVRCGIQEAGRAFAELVSDAPGGLVLGRQTQLLLVEPARPRHVPGGDIGIHRRFLQHGALLIGDRQSQEPFPGARK